MSITFGGLATGLDTDSIVSALMKIEQQPLDRLKKDKEYLASRQQAFTDFDTKLKALLAAVEDIDTTAELSSYSASLASTDYVDAVASSSAVAGSYEIEVQSLAQLQKDASVEGFADKTTANLTGTIKIGANPDINYASASLTDVAAAINATTYGVNASIINDGSTSGYRLVLTGDDASTSVTVNTSTGSITFDPSGHTQINKLAAIVVDGISISGTSNTITDAVPGVTLTLNKVNTAGETTNLNVGVDADAVQAKIDTFVSKYNDVINFIAAQSDADWGTDSAFRSTKRTLQTLLVTAVNGTGNFDYFAQLGITTSQYDGTLQTNSTTLSAAITDNFTSVDKLLIGETGVTGIFSQFADYLDGVTDSIDGFMVTRKKTTDDGTKRIDLNITRMEDRLTKREKTLRAQFSALEELVNSMNSQSSYLTQQMNMLSKIGSK